MICVTGKTEVTDKITAFSLGAEDYLVKPFDPLELRARVDAKLKNFTNREEKHSSLKVSNIEINLSTHSVTLVDSEERYEINLTQTEFKILVCLARRPEQVFTRDQLLVSVWGESARVTDRAVDTHVCALRRKIHEGDLSIRSVPGIGYKLVLATKKSERQEAS